MELNDNSSTEKEKSTRVSSTSPTLTAKTLKTDETKISKKSVICTFCSKKTGTENFAVLGDKPELLGTLSKLEIEISPINDYSDYICYQCVFKIHCIQDYKRIWTANIQKSRINHYYRCGDKEMVRRLITLKPSTSTRSAHQSRTRSNGSSFNENPTKEGSIISHSTDNNSNVGQNERLQDSTKESASNAKETAVNNDLSEIRISSVNSLHDPDNTNRQKRQKRLRSGNLIENTIDNSKQKDVHRNSSILTNEAIDLNHTKKSSLLENGFLQESSNHTNDTFSTISNKKRQKTSHYLEKPPTPSDQNKTLLNVMYEENEPAAVTESGGEISSRMTSYKEAFTMKCIYCDRVYKRITFLIRHQRKHERESQKVQKSSTSTFSKTKSNPFIGFDCEICSIKFPTKHKLNQHKKLHLKTFTCQYCMKEFILTWEAEFHEAICSGAAQAKVKKPSTKYYTRSFKSKNIDETENSKKRNNHIFNNHVDDEYDEMSDISEVDTLFSSRMRNTLMWAKNLTQMQNEHEKKGESEKEIEIDFHNNFDDTGQSLNLHDDNETIDEHMQINQPSMVPLSNSNPKEKSKPTNQPTKRLTIAENVLQMARITCEPYGDLSSDSYNEDAVIIFLKCQNSGCEYQNIKLDNVMKHDNNTHGIRPLYYCKKCKGSFLRKYYLQLHCENQDPGCFLCYKCRAEFFFEEMLHKHLEEHRIREMYADEYPCKLCNMKFLDETSLMEHLATKEHLSLKATPKINFKIKNSYPILRKQEETDACKDNNNMYSTLFEGPLELFNSYLLEGNSNRSENDINLTPQQYVSRTKILKLKKYESKNYKYECNCIKKNCYNCQKHRKMIPIYGREPRPSKKYAHRSCTEVRLPLWNTWCVI